MLTEGLDKPDAIDLDRLTFLTKARLAVAMGLMSDTTIPPLVSLNTLRNNFAHRANYKFTQKNKIDLLNSIPTYVTQVILTDGEGKNIHTKENAPLERILRVLICLMEARRQDVVEAKKANAAAVKRLRDVLDKGKRRSS
jgi:hypothetical protein